MAYLEWTEQYSVGVAKIDQEHQQLVALINRLYDGVMARQSQDLLKPVLYEMTKYAAEHFQTEEHYMEQYGYPQQAAHVAQHQQFVGKVEDFLKEFEAGKLFLSTEIMDFLKTWLIQHIQGADKQYGPFFNEHGLH